MGATSYLIVLGVLLSSASARNWQNVLHKLARRQEEPSRISFKECTLDLDLRLDCGYHGIDMEECHSRGCCWEALNTSALPLCYHSKPTITEICMVGENERVNCGHAGIRKEQCLASHCCWQPSNNFDQPWCYSYKAIEWPVECGLQAVQPNMQGSRIVGGEEAKPHSWPWQASLDKAGFGHFCGASIINSQWLLTAAHCDIRDEVTGVVGAHGLHDNGTDTPQRIAVVEQYKHDSWDSQTIDNDVMLLKLAEEIIFSDEVSPICLPDAKAHPRPGQRCYATGWGTLTLGGERPEYLQQVMLPYITEEMCEEWYSEMSGYIPYITPNMLCAGYEEGGRSGCHGDSGGPYVCYEEDHWELHGVVSWGGPCGHERVASVFARVSQFSDWIKRIMTENQK